MTTELYKEIRLYLRDLIAGTPYEGHVFAVGGCCRDEVMGNEIKDVDLAVDLPDGGIEFAIWLHGRGLTVGEPVLFPKFGTSKLVLRRFPDDDLQVVQTRREKYDNRNSRCPETAFGTLEEDCMRRDLTINSLYYDISRQRLIDLTGLGVKHIHEHVLQTPADPYETFDDDPVRILRCVRFASRFGWPITGDIYKAMSANARRLDIISRPRLMGEFTKLLMSANAAEGIRTLRNTGGLCHVLPQISSLKRLTDDYNVPNAAEEKKPRQRKRATRGAKTPPVPQQTNVWQHTLDTLKAVGDTPSLALRLAALLHEVGKAQTKVRRPDGTMAYGQYETKGAKIARQMLRGLHFESPVVRETIFLILHHLVAEQWGDRAERLKDKELRRLQAVCGTPERFGLLMQLIDARNRVAGIRPGQVAAIVARSEQMTADGTSMFGFELPLTLDEIMQARGTTNERLGKRIEQHLLRMACLDPKRTDYAQLVRSYR